MIAFFCIVGENKGKKHKKTPKKQKTYASPSEKPMLMWRGADKSEKTRQKKGTDKIRGTAGGPGAGEMGEVGPQVRECAPFGGGLGGRLGLAGSDMLSVC